MDPSTTLYDLLNAIERRDNDTAAECARNLADWLEKDGFVPAIESFGSLEDNWSSWYVRTRA